jgi:hypothetical protein
MFLVPKLNDKFFVVVDKIFPVVSLLPTIEAAFHHFCSGILHLDPIW